MKQYTKVSKSTSRIDSVHQNQMNLNQFKSGSIRFNPELRFELKSIRSTYTTFIVLLTRTFCETIVGEE